MGVATIRVGTKAVSVMGPSGRPSKRELGKYNCSSDEMRNKSSENNLDGEKKSVDGDERYEGR